jgi:hypothetical protein
MSKESIISKINKIMELAERGSPGEKEVAISKLYYLLDKHGLTIEDIKNSEKGYYWFPYNTAFEKEILFQITFKTLNSGELSYRQKKGKRKVAIELTPIQNAEIKMLYNIYKKSFRDEMNILLRAFISKHQLHSEQRTATEVDKEQLERILRMSMGIQSVNIPRAMIGE